MSNFGFARSNAFVAAAEGVLGRRASCKVNSSSNFLSSSLEVMDLKILVKDLGIPVSFSLDFL